MRDSSCNNGTCQWTSVATGVTSPGAIALDGANVYFTARTSICQVAETGGVSFSIAATTDTASSGPGEIVVANRRVYFSDDGAPRRRWRAR